RQHGERPRGHGDRFDRGLARARPAAQGDRRRRRIGGAGAAPAPGGLRPDAGRAPVGARTGGRDRRPAAAPARALDLTDRLRGVTRAGSHWPRWRGQCTVPLRGTADWPERHLSAVARSTVANGRRATPATYRQAAKKAHPDPSKAASLTFSE